MTTSWNATVKRGTVMTTKEKTFAVGDEVVVYLSEQRTAGFARGTVTGYRECDWLTGYPAVDVAMHDEPPPHNVRRWSPHIVAHVADFRAANHLVDATGKVVGGGPGMTDNSEANVAALADHDIVKGLGAAPFRVVKGEDI